jgi:PKD repeat protein
MINPNVSFTDLSIDPVFWNWNFGDGETKSMDQNPNHMYGDTGTYIVQLIVHNSKMCYDTIYKPIRIKDEFAIYFPNAFTPNDDGVNEQFKPLAVGVAEFKMLIFDRWGLSNLYNIRIGKRLERNIWQEQEKSARWILMYTWLLPQEKMGRRKSLSDM